MSQLAEATPSSPAAATTFPRGPPHTAAAPDRGVACSSKNHPVAVMGSVISTPANGMQAEALQEAAGAQGASPACQWPATMAPQTGTHSDPNDSNISNPTTYKVTASKRKAKASPQTTSPKRAKASTTDIDNSNIYNSNIDNIDNMPGAGDPVDHLAIVKRWIAEREAMPSTLTVNEINAIAVLKGTLGRIPEPDLGTLDWVSLLFKYKDARYQVGANFKFDEMTNDDKTFRAVCFFTGELGAPALRFPGKLGGLLPVDHDGTLGEPSFLKKKDAKRYAAKCCVEWLMANGYMPADGTTASLAKIKPKSFLPFQIPASGGASLVIQGNNKASAPVDDALATSHVKKENIATSNPATSTTATNTAAELSSNPVSKPTQSAASDDEVLATQRVKELCEGLGICQPQYIIVPSKTHGPDFFDGHADFREDDPSFEDDVGRVYGGYTRKGTRERVAEKVLAVLLEMYDRRQAVTKKVLAEYDAQTSSTNGPLRVGVWEGSWGADNL